MNIEHGFKRLLIVLTVIWLGSVSVAWYAGGMDYGKEYFYIFIETTVAAWVLLYVLLWLVPWLISGFKDSD